MPYVWISEPGQQTVGIDLVVARETIPVLEGTLSTPARGVLEGITRRTVLEIAEAFGIPDRYATAVNYPVTAATA